MNLKVSIRTSFVIVISILILVYAIWIFVSYIPFYLPSYLVWGGNIIIGAGCIGLIFPIKRLGLKTRKRSAVIVLSGLLLVVITLMWPPSITASRQAHHRLDDFLPQFQDSEYHQELVSVSVPVERLIEVAPTISMADIPAAVLLMQIRYFVTGQSYQVDTTPILDIEPGSGFMVLDDSNPAELVYGMAGRPWVEEAAPNIHTGDQFKDFKQPGHIKVAFNIRIIDKGDQGSLISTETRILGNDTSAQKIFARYWRIIYPGSSIIRRVWLNAIINKAEKTMM